MIVFLIRHGEVGPKLEGGLGITENGYAQIKCFAEKYRDYRFDRIISSNLDRARLTMQGLLKENSSPCGIIREAEEIEFLLKEGST